MHTVPPWLIALILLPLLPSDPHLGPSPPQEANYLVTKAYQLTSLTSVTLLDCFTVPAVMALSVVVLRRRFAPQQYVAAALCIVGLTVLVVSDRQASGSPGSVLLGDALVILGACLYAVCNVLQERLLAAAPFQEVLAMLGCWGALLSLLQVAALETPTLLQLQLRLTSIGPFFTFAGALFAFYSLVPFVLMWGGATVLNLSLLTSDFWAAGARMVWFGGFGGTLPAFAASLALVASGLALYACFDQPQQQEWDQPDGEGVPGRWDTPDSTRTRVQGWLKAACQPQTPPVAYTMLTPHSSSNGSSRRGSAEDQGGKQRDAVRSSTSDVEGGLSPRSPLTNKGSSSRSQSAVPGPSGPDKSSQKT
jgi:drug/metabolite transporter (DMT)-like permease